MAMTILILQAQQRVSLVPPETMREFEELLNALDVRALNRTGWDRIKEIIIEAMVESVLGGSRDADIRGLTGMLSNLDKWRLCEAYDGRP